MAKTPTWQRKAGQSESGGLNEAGRRSLKAAGHDIKRPQPEGGSRKDSFCARMKGMKAKLTSSETANDPDSRINKSLRKWKCADGGSVDPYDGVQHAAKGGKAYPLADRKDWTAAKHYDEHGGKLTHMSPSEFLDRTRPLNMDAPTERSIDAYKGLIDSQHRMNPLQLLANGLEDGRHRATAAKELGVESVPVVDFRADGGEVDDTAHQFVQQQLNTGEPQAPQYVHEADFPARAARGIEAADTAAARVNNLLANAAGMPAMQSQEGRSASEVVQAPLPVDPYKAVQQAAGQWQGGDKLGAAETMATGMPMLGIVPVDVAKGIGQKSLPQSREFTRAVEATPGARIEEGSLVMPVSRGQKPEQNLSPSVREGVFYLPHGDKRLSYYGGTYHYGGPEKITGETAFNNPLFIKGATGGKAPEAAYSNLYGKDAFKKLESDVRSVVNEQYWMSKQDPSLYEERVANLLSEYGANPDMASHIIRNSTEGNQLRYALQENIIGNAIRNAGHDAILGYSTKRDVYKTPFFSEVFDLRESHYPSPSGQYRLHKKFEPKGKGGEVVNNADPYDNIQEASRISPRTRRASN